MTADRDEGADWPGVLDGTASATMDTGQSTQDGPTAPGGARLPPILVPEDGDTFSAGMGPHDGPGAEARDGAPPAAMRTGADDHGPLAALAVELVILRDVLAVRDAEHRRVVERLERELADQYAATASIGARLHDLESSETWRATRPLRELLTRHPRAARLLRGVGRIVWRGLRGRLQLWPVPASSVPIPAAMPADDPATIRFASIEVPPPRPAVPTPRRTPADIIVCVHNALDDVRRCLMSLERHTSGPYRLILVDDGSDEATRDALTLHAQAVGATLLRHEVAQGYTLAANAGLRASDAPLVVLLNSDTEVTDGWLDRMADLMERDPRIGIVGPLSNIASWQSVPKVIENGDWARNALPPDVTANDVARIVARSSRRNGVAIGFLNGFCLLIRREVIDAIGIFDEQAFGAGYGEENDFCIRARQAGWDLRVADDTFVLHHQSRSYGNERRLQLALKADQALVAKHDVATLITPFVEHARGSLLLHRARAQVAVGLRRLPLIKTGTAAFRGRRLGILLPIGAPGGGGNVIIQEALAARAFGVTTWIINLESERESFSRAYPDLPLPVIYGPDDAMDAFVEALARELALDAVIATAAGSFAWLPPRRPGLHLGYYIQDNETLFVPAGSEGFEQALTTYRIRPEVPRFTKTAWNAAAVEEIGGRRPVVIGPSVDLDRFAPGSDRALDCAAPVRVSAMVRPSTARRNAHMTLRVLRRLLDDKRDRVEVSCFGAGPDEYRSMDIPLHGMRLLNGLRPPEVATLLGETDIFLDCSHWQAMGLTALEAMASGAAVVVPRQGGAAEFCIHGFNAFVVDSSDIGSCLAAVRRLTDDHHTRLAFQRNALETAHRFPPEVAALGMLRTIFHP